MKLLANVVFVLISLILLAQMLGLLSGGEQKR